MKTHHTAEGAGRAVQFRPRTCNGKLVPVAQEITAAGKDRPVPIGPHMSSTATAIRATCDPLCPFNDVTGVGGEGCFASSGYTAKESKRLNEAAIGLSAADVTAAEVIAVRTAYGGGTIPQDGGRDGKSGRDLRLHVFGDVLDQKCALMLAAEATIYHERHGGSVWTFTHSWRWIGRDAWGPNINVLASVERADQIGQARSRGYAAAIVVPDFESLDDLPPTGTKIVQCRAEATRGRTTCVQCRLCVEHDLLAEKVTVAFAVHGPGRRQALVALRRINANPDDLVRPAP